MNANTTPNIPLLTPGVMPVALLPARIERLPKYWFTNGVMHYNTIGQAPVFVEVRGTVTYIEVQKKPANYKKVEFANMPAFQKAVKPIRRKAA